ncbi:unnamed protein product, partial [Symbiodinium necroappetens]
MRSSYFSAAFALVATLGQAHDPRVRLMYFDDDLIDFGVASGAAGADEGDDDDYAWHEGTGSGASSNSSSVQTLEVSSATPRRKRGSRGGSQKAASDKEKDVKRWRSGAIPPAPVFDGDIEKDPYCLRHYKRKLSRWLKITREFLPPNEQALRALEQLKGEAELEFEEVDDSKFDCKDGVAKLVKDLEVSFGERELFRQGGTIREFEQVCRLQGESVSAFIRRFRLLERKLKDNRVPPYPEQARVVKLLDGLRLDDKSVSSVLLAAGNQYDMTKVLEALRIQYPAGMTITGIPRARFDYIFEVKCVDFLYTLHRVYEEYPETEAWDLPQEDDAELVVPDHEETVLPDIPEEENENLIQDEEPLYEEAEWTAQDQDPVGDMLAEAAQALTVTSKKLAGLAQARGFYQPKGASSTSSGKGKGKKGSFPSGKGKGKHGKSGNKGVGKSKGKGKGKLDAQSALQQQRLQGSLCLGCGSADHWLRDCPNFNMQNAQLASASVTGLCLDADGAVEHYSSWTASTNVDAYVPEQDDSPNVVVLRKKKVYFKLPPLHEFEPKVDRPPNVLLQYCEGPCSAYIIADTGCQRQVAGKAWHDQKALEILPLKRLEFPDKCKFSFGPSAPVASVGRNVYPVAIAGVHFSLSVSVVIAKAPPRWLVRWRAFLQRLLGFVNNVQQMVLLYSMTALKGNLKDRILRNYGVPSTATTVLSTVGALAAQTALTNQSYLRKPDQCNHSSGLRAYGGGGTKVRICDLCGSRWVVMPNGNQVPATPKASPQAKTPLDLPDRVVQALRKEREAKKPKAKAAGVGSTHEYVDRDAAYPASWHPSSISSREFVRGPPAATATRRSSPTARLQARPKPSAPPAPKRRTWMASPPQSDNDRMSVDRHSVGTYDQDWTTWEEPNFFIEHNDQLEGSEGSQFDPNDLVPDVDEYGEVKSGMIKRLLGNQRAVHSMWLVERDVYQQRTRQAREMRRFLVDLLEIYGGTAEITAQALRAGLRALQPVDRVYGLNLQSRSDFDKLEALVLRHRPYLLVYEIPCTAWSNIQHLNRAPHELQVLRDQQGLAIQRMVRLIKKARQVYGSHFLLENPAYTDFWKHPSIQHLQQLPGVDFQVGCMCAHKLMDPAGKLLKKPTGWMSDLPLVLAQVAKPCQCAPGMHGQVLGGNSQRAQVYTLELAQAVVSGLHASLEADGDERMTQHALNFHDHASVYFLDINRHEDSWLPLLKEVDEQLKGKVRPDKVIPLNTPFGEQVKALVPWKLERLQVCRTPIQRRLPLEVLQAGARHRGAALWLSDGNVKLEAETVDSIMAQSANKFAAPVRAAIFFFGSAPDTSLNETENAKPEPTVKTTQKEDKVDDTEVLRPHEPGYRDITFPGAPAAPRWLLQVLRRVHTNLGHPSTATLVRHLAHSGASELAVQCARKLKCEVCRRVQPPRQPRPAKPFTPQRFNDKLGLDVLWLKDIRGKLHGYLSQVDEATCYHVLSYLADRTEEEVMKVLINGWMSFFGPPDSLVLDADGCFRGYRFETLQAQCATQVRYVPADAHYQLGRTERHGQAIKYIVQRLVSQFSPVGAAELNVITAMAAFAKNNLLNRSGGVEACQLATDSERLQRIEAVRQKVAYFRQKNGLDGEGSTEGYRQGTIVAIDKGTLWLRNTRGRLVSCSREQVRDVGGEEEWWAPSQQDLDLLKKSDQDLADKHSLAFRSDDVPGPGQDQAALDMLDSALQPATLSVPATPSSLPVLDAAGQPVPEGQIPLVAPLMLVPPTPRSAPGTPRLKAKLRTVPEDNVIHYHQRNKRPHQQDNVFHYHQRNKRLHQQDNVIHYLVLLLMLSNLLASVVYIGGNFWSAERAARTAEDMEPETALLATTVNSPLLVESWFDEVKEREAMNQFFNDHASPQDSGPRDVLSSQANLANASSSLERQHGSIQRLDVLRRHGRSDAFLPGWDGSPCELQPFFSQECYLTAADRFGKHVDVKPPKAQTRAKSEEMAKRLLHQKKFRGAVCHQLLDAVDMPMSQRRCLEHERPTSALALGLYAHGGFQGITRRSQDHKHLIKYLLEYLKFHGMDDKVTSLFVSRNGKASLHRDNHNLDQSLNWVSTVGDYRGGSLWVECRSPHVPADAVWKSINGESVPGFLADPRGRVLSFHPKCRHETQPFAGERYAITAYTSRSLATAGPELRRDLRRLGFLQSSTFGTYNADVDQPDNDKDILDDEPVHQTYPLKAWQTPGEGEAVVMESSNSEGADGPGESVSRAQKQALKKELPWQAMSQAEVPKFVQALADEWAEWQKWSSCQAVHLDPSQVDAKLILRSR